MAMRARGGAANSRRATRSGLVRPVYEDFRPVSEWLQDDESHILNINLPGFMKEQIRVTTEGRNTIRVRGERLVAGNKWSRFLENFQVPENGEMNSIRAKFQGGILSMTVPKEKVRKVVPREAGSVGDIRKQSNPQKGHVEAIPDVKAKDGMEPQNLPGDLETRHGQDGNQKQPIPQKGQSEEDKSLEPHKAPAEPSNILDDDQIGRSLTQLRKESNDKASVEPKNAQDPDGDQRGRSFTPMRTTGNVISQNDGKKESETKEKLIASEKQDDETKVREGKETMDSSELPEAETTRTKKIEELYGASKNQKRNKAKKGLTELNEERQLLMNMGVAMLVIMALTAYVTYNFASAKDKN